MTGRRNSHAGDPVSGIKSDADWTDRLGAPLAELPGNVVAFERGRVQLRILHRAYPLPPLRLGPDDAYAIGRIIRSPRTRAAKIMIWSAGPTAYARALRLARSPERAELGGIRAAIDRLLLAVRLGVRALVGLSPSTPALVDEVQVLDKLPKSHRGRALHLQAIVGARVGEIAALKVLDYQRDTGVLFLSGADEGRGRKGKKARRGFPLPKEGRQLVLEQIARRADEPEGYLFPMGAHVAPSLNGLLDSACERAGVPRFSTHGLRRMVVMRMLDAGNNAKTVSKLTGHSLKTLLAHYVRPTPDHLQQAVRRASLGSFGPTAPEGEAEIIDFPTGTEDGS